LVKWLYPAYLQSLAFQERSAQNGDKFAQDGVVLDDRRMIVWGIDNT
jgi:hypothetical protein